MPTLTFTTSMGNMYPCKRLICDSAVEQVITDQYLFVVVVVFPKKSHIYSWAIVLTSFMQGIHLYSFHMCKNKYGVIFWIFQSVICSVVFYLGRKNHLPHHLSFNAPLSSYVALLWVIDFINRICMLVYRQYSYYISF